MFDDERRQRKSKFWKKTILSGTFDGSTAGKTGDICHILKAEMAVMESN